MANRQFWQLVLLLHAVMAVMLFGAWWFIRRSIRRLLDQYWSRAETAEDPPLASATEAAVIVAREKYDRGEFRRAVVRRVPRDLFGDDLILECGHTPWPRAANEDVAARDLSHVN